MQAHIGEGNLRGLCRHTSEKTIFSLIHFFDTETKLSIAPLEIKNKKPAKSKKIRNLEKKLYLWIRLVLKHKRAKTIECETSIERSYQSVTKPEIF